MAIVAIRKIDDEYLTAAAGPTSHSPPPIDVAAMIAPGPDDPEEVARVERRRRRQVGDVSNGEARRGWRAGILFRPEGEPRSWACADDITARRRLRRCVEARCRRWLLPRSHAATAGRHPTTLRGRLTPTIWRSAHATRTSIELVQGTLDMLSSAPLHGARNTAMASCMAIRASSQDALQIQSRCSLYPALHRLEKQGGFGCRLDAAWKLSENRQRAKYYRLTAGGKEAARRGAIAAWNRMPSGKSLAG